jgi:hypothetical protein
MPRKVVILLIGLTVSLVASDTIYWGLAQQRLRQQFAVWADGARVNGWTVTNAAPSSGGWPLVATLSVPNLVIKGGDPDIPGGLAWSTDRVELRIALMRPNVLEIEPEGIQRFRLADRPDITCTAERLRAWVPLEPDSSARSGELAATNLRTSMPEESDAEGGLTIGSLSILGTAKPAALHGEAVVTIALAASAIGLPPGQRWSPGSRIERMRLEAILDGPLPRAHGLTAWAHAWRESGGSLDVRQVSLNWGNLALEAAATLALDDHLQPTGAGAVRMTGYAAALEALATNGVLSRSAATAAKAVLSLLARMPEDEGPAEVEAPLSLESGTLSLRQLPLLRIPTIDWREP